MKPRGIKGESCRNFATKPNGILVITNSAPKLFGRLLADDQKIGRQHQSVNRGREQTYRAHERQQFELGSLIPSRPERLSRTTPTRPSANPQGLQIHLRSQLDHAIGRQTEVAGCAAGIAEHCNKNLASPSPHAGIQTRNQRFPTEEKRSFHRVNR